MKMRKMLQDYLAMRRSLGFKLRTAGEMLYSFVAFLEQHNKDIITTELAVAWAKLPKNAKPIWLKQRLCFVRIFARYCVAIDLQSEIPADNLLPTNYQRPIPYIFTDNEIRDLLQSTAQLSAKHLFFAQTLYCLFGLLAVTGLRIREALNLMIKDVDLQAGILTVRNTKFNKSRLIPLHDTTIKILDDYRKQREKIMKEIKCEYWFIDKKLKNLDYPCVRDNFNKLLTVIKLSNQTHSRRPHLHDLRHYFAISTLKKWYDNGEDVERRLPMLSAYLGHVSSKETFWYLSACPELMGKANKRLEQYWGKKS